jgi:hypothetical protein
VWLVTEFVVIIIVSVFVSHEHTLSSINFINFIDFIDFINIIDFIVVQRHFAAEIFIIVICIFETNENTLPSVTLVAILVAINIVIWLFFNTFSSSFRTQLLIRSGLVQPFSVIKFVVLISHGAKRICITYLQYEIS